MRVLWANLHNWATDLAALQRLIEREKPDIAVLTELAADHEPTLRGTCGPRCPTSRGCRTSSALGVMLLAKKPPETLHFDLGGRSRAAAGGAALPGGRACLTVLGLHASRPFPRDDGARDRQLDHAAAVARRHIERGEHVVLVGDLNVTPFSPVFHRCWRKAASGQHTMLAERPARPMSTWWLGNTGIGLPIDHALLSPGVWHRRAPARHADRQRSPAADLDIACRR